MKEPETKPARRQTPAGPQKKKPAPPGATYNIWYHKYSGGDRERGPRQKAESRVDIARDSGTTRGSRTKQATFICVTFAKGCCPSGPDCNYLHRIPSEEDVVETLKDCFGRERHEEFRDDMGGIGSFSSESRTLYVNRFHQGANVKETLHRHFSPFGAIERIHVLEAKAVAFITYVRRPNAEFAKEAMSDQSLENEEILNVRWANDDPNPAAQAQKRKQAIDQTVEQMRKKHKDYPPTDTFVTDESFMNPGHEATPGQYQTPMPFNSDIHPPQPDSSNIGYQNEMENGYSPQQPYTSSIPSYNSHHPIISATQGLTTSGSALSTAILGSLKPLESSKQQMKVNATHPPVKKSPATSTVLSSLVGAYGDSSGEESEGD